MGCGSSKALTDDVKSTQVPDSISNAATKAVNGVKTPPESVSNEDAADTLNEAKTKQSSEMRDDDLMVALNEACVGIHTLVINNANTSDIQKFIGTNPGSLEARDNHGLTPLHLAAKLGRFDSLKALIECNAFVNAKSLEGNTPLHYAIGYNRFDCAVKLKHAGCNEDLKNNSNFRAATGFDGLGSFGVAAINSANGIKQADIALKICEQYSDDVNLLRFLDGVTTLKRNLQFKGWNEIHDSKVQIILAKIKAKDSGNVESALKEDVPQEPFSSGFCNLFCL